MDLDMGVTGGDGEYSFDITQHWNNTPQNNTHTETAQPSDQTPNTSNLDMEGYSYSMEDLEAVLGPPLTTQSQSSNNTCTFQRATETTHQSIDNNVTQAANEAKRFKLTPEEIRTGLCTLCGVTFNPKSNPIALYRHIKYFHEPSKPNLRFGLTTCRICSASFENSNYDKALYDHMKVVHQLVPRFYCKFARCTRSFPSEQERVIHEVDHATIATAPETKFQCPIEGCPKTYSSKSSLRNHTKSHDLPLVCVHCDKTFSSSALLRRHLSDAHGLSQLEARDKAAASPVRTHPCEVCGKMYANGIVLQRHLSTVHGTPRPIATKSSPPRPAKETKSGEEESNVVEEIPGKWFRCVYCGEAFPSADDFHQHSNTNHPNNQPGVSIEFHCTHCASRFPSMVEMWIHRKTAHLSTNESPFEQSTSLQMEESNAVVSDKDTDTPLQPTTLGPNKFIIILNSKETEAGTEVSYAEDGLIQQAQLLEVDDLNDPRVAEAIQFQIQNGNPLQAQEVDGSEENFGQVGIEGGVDVFQIQFHDAEGLAWDETQYEGNTLPTGGMEDGSIEAMDVDTDQIVMLPAEAELIQHEPVLSIQSPVEADPSCPTIPPLIQIVPPFPRELQPTLNSTSLNVEDTSLQMSKSQEHIVLPQTDPSLPPTSPTQRQASTEELRASDFNDLLKLSEDVDVNKEASAEKGTADTADGKEGQEDTDIEVVDLVSSDSDSELDEWSEDDMYEHEDFVRKSFYPTPAKRAKPLDTKGKSATPSAPSSKGDGKSPHSRPCPASRKPVNESLLKPKGTPTMKRTQTTPSSKQKPKTIAPPSNPHSLVKPIQPPRIRTNSVSRSKSTSLSTPNSPVKKGVVKARPLSVQQRLSNPTKDSYSVPCNSGHNGRIGRDVGEGVKVKRVLRVADEYDSMSISDTESDLSNYELEVEVDTGDGKEQRSIAPKESEGKGTPNTSIKRPGGSGVLGRRTLMEMKTGVRVELERTPTTKTYASAKVTVVVPIESRSRKERLDSKVNELCGMIRELVEVAMETDEDDFGEEQKQHKREEGMRKGTSGKVIRPMPPLSPRPPPNKIPRICSPTPPPLFVSRSGRVIKVKRWDDDDSAQPTPPPRSTTPIPPVNTVPSSTPEPKQRGRPRTRPLPTNDSTAQSSTPTRGRKRNASESQLSMEREDKGSGDIRTRSRSVSRLSVDVKDQQGDGEGVATRLRSTSVSSPSSHVTETIEDKGKVVGKGRRSRSLSHSSSQAKESKKDKIEDLGNRRRSQSVSRSSKQAKESLEDKKEDLGRGRRSKSVPRSSPQVKESKEDKKKDMAKRRRSKSVPRSSTPVKELKEDCVKGRRTTSVSVSSSQVKETNEDKRKVVGTGRRRQGVPRSSTQETESKEDKKEDLEMGDRNKSVPHSSAQAKKSKGDKEDSGKGHTSRSVSRSPSHVAETNEHVGKRRRRRSVPCSSSQASESKEDKREDVVKGRRSRSVSRSPSQANEAKEDNMEDVVKGPRSVSQANEAKEDKREDVVKGRRSISRSSSQANESKEEKMEDVGKRRRSSSVPCSSTQTKESKEDKLEEVGKRRRSSSVPCSSKQTKDSTEDKMEEVGKGRRSRCVTPSSSQVEESKECGGTGLGSVCETGAEIGKCEKTDVEGTESPSLICVGFDAGEDKMRIDLGTILKLRKKLRAPIRPRSRFVFGSIDGGGAVVPWRLTKVTNPKLRTKVRGKKK